MNKTLKTEIDRVASTLGCDDGASGRERLAKKLGVTTGALSYAQTRELLPARWFWPMWRFGGVMPEPSLYAWASEEDAEQRAKSRARRSGGAAEISQQTRKGKQRRRRRKDAS